jgi:serine/threonine protein kinase
LLGQTIGNYRVTRLLGEGGMGAVYLAEHPVIGRQVAIKVLHIALSRDTEVVARFFNEARAIHTIGHEHIVEILDFGQTPEGQPYFVMELLGGEAMNDRLARGAIPAPEVADIADQICRALAAAHGKGIVHRDLKPHNVQLLGISNGRMHVKLLDFGVAKIANSGMGDGSQSVKTRTGSLMGTPIYMSPEQCRGSGKLDHRTDIYSLGVMLFEMLAGRPPFVAEGAGELFAMHMLEEPPQLAALAPAAPPAMVAAVMRSLAKNVDDRFATMEELRGALLGQVAFEPISAFTPVSAGRTGSTLSPAARLKAGGTMVYPSPGSSTTLSSSTSEIEDDLRPTRKSRAGLTIAVVAAVAAAGAAAFVLFGRPAPGATAKTGVTGPPAQEPPAAQTVTVRFEAEPAGAHVFRLTDDRDLGAVPLTIKLPRAGGRPQYVFRLGGYKDQAMSADLGADTTLRASLEKQAPAPAREAPPPEPGKLADKTADQPDNHGEPPRKRAPAHRSRQPHSGAASDEDGLAIPSF